MLVAGRPAPIVGRVCMDSCMIDVTDIPGVEEGDEVVINGMKICRRNENRDSRVRFT